MSNHLLHMLREWQPLKDDLEWVFGIIYKTEGSCYRKAGAMVLLSNMGHQLGVLSGGCLESDIQQNARRVMQDGRPRSLTYDDNDEDDIAFRLGIGCGGVVHLMLLPVNAQNDYLSLPLAFEAMQTSKHCLWSFAVTEKAEAIATHCQATSTTPSKLAMLEEQNGELWLNVPLSPPPHLLLVGGGFDAVPVAQGAINLGWTVTVWDPRPAHARQEHFSFVSQIIKETDASALNEFFHAQPFNAAILMSHHKDIDANAFKQIFNKPLSYIAMIGPEHRRKEIVERANVDSHQVTAKFVGPVGLDIGGDLPESIALSMLAECHAVLHNKNATSLSHIFRLLQHDN